MEQKILKNRILIFYGIPAYGHLHSNLYLVDCLSRQGFQVIYYSMKPFQQEIETHGGIYRSYPIDEKAIDLSDGKRILKLYRLILQYTRDMLPVLLSEAQKERPAAVIFDSLALWGRAAGSLLKAPCYSFYSIEAVNLAVKESLFAYSRGFGAEFFRYMGECKKAFFLAYFLKKKYGLKKLGLFSVLMNQGDKNLMGYSRLFQPGGKKFDSTYLFLGPLSMYRKEDGETIAIDSRKTLIYISLGTIFNQDKLLLKEIIAQLGGEEESAVQVVMVCDWKKQLFSCSLPKNFTVRPFLNQRHVMKQADLFITAGGMNSIHQALYYNVPCLFCPQQGEQFVNARQFTRMGFGRILKSPGSLWEEAQQAIKLKESWNEETRQAMLKLQIKDALSLFLQTEKGNVSENRLQSEERRNI